MSVTYTIQIPIHPENTTYNIVKSPELEQGPHSSWLVKGSSGILIIHATAQNMVTRAEFRIKIHFYPPASEASREVANLT